MKKIVTDVSDKTKDLDFESKELFKVDEKKHNFVIQGRSFLHNFTSVERKHDYIKKNFNVRNKVTSKDQPKNTPDDQLDENKQI